MFIDTHCHCLWGVDDASKDEFASLEMFKVAKANGVTKIICTSHCIVDHAKYRNTTEMLNTAFLKAVELLEKEKIDIELYLGSELYLSDLAIDWVKKGKHTPLNNTNYILVEFPWHTKLPCSLSNMEMVKQLINMGYRIIIAHPERYTCFQEDFTLFETYKSLGCYFQINRTSLIEPGVENYDFAWRIVKEGYANTIATDAHFSYGSRIIKFDDIYEKLKNTVGVYYADLLCKENPLNIINGNNLLFIREN